MSLFFYFCIVQILSKKSSKCSTGSLIIQESTYQIQESEYEECNEFTGELIIPDTVKSIAKRAFYGCTGLEGALQIPDQLTTIGVEAFYGCTGFTSLKLGNKLSIIYEKAFQNCNGMSGSLTIPKKVSGIQRYAFSGTNFNHIIFEGSFVTCGPSAFPSNIFATAPKDYKLSTYCELPVEKQKEKNKNWIWILVAVLVIAGLIIFFIYYYKCRFYDCNDIKEKLADCCKNCFHNTDSNAEDIESSPSTNKTKPKNVNLSNNHKNDKIYLTFDDGDFGYSESEEETDSESEEEIEKIIYFNKKLEKYEKNIENDFEESEESKHIEQLVDSSNSDLFEEIEYSENKKNSLPDNGQVLMVEAFAPESDEEILIFDRAPLHLNDDVVVNIEDGQKMIHLGKLRVIHATTFEAAKNILKEKSFRPGKKGMFGAGIYFAANKRIARHKCTLKKYVVAAYVESVVDFGNSLILDRPNNKITLDYIKKYNCDSVMGRRKEGTDWEFVVYESSRTNPEKMLCLKQRKNTA